jgi:thymidylate kinase
MIIMLEGPRHVGKTFLLDLFFEQNKNPNIQYYKFLFAKYLEDFGIKSHEKGSGVHYFSIANVLTILELNKTVFKDKVLIFDRSIFSAYTWSIYRNRLPKEELLDEFEKILNSDLYQDCGVLFLDRSNVEITQRQEKDLFGEFENYQAEKDIFIEIFTKFKSQISNSSKKTWKKDAVNSFNLDSAQNFCTILNSLAELNK